MPSVSTLGKKFWYASLNLWHADADHPSGGEWKRTWRKTGLPATSPKKEAEEIAAALQAAGDKAGPESRMRLDARTFAAALEGIWESAGLEVPRVTASWSDFMEEYLAACQINEGTVTVYRNFLNSFAEHIGPAKASGMMQGISHKDCQSFYDALLASGLTPKTCRNYLKSVRACFARAVHMGIIPTNPAALVRTPLGPPGQRLPLTLEEVVAILRTLEDPPEVYTGRFTRGYRGPAFLRGMTEEWRTAVLLGLWCGMRLGDATHRRWSDFDAELTQVTFLPEKKSRAGRPVTLPVVGALRAHLLAEREAGPKHGGRRLGNPEGLLTPQLAAHNKNSERFGKLLNLAGIACDRAERKSALAKPKRTKSFHSLRHTILTEMARHGVDKQLRQLLADHDDPLVNDRYTHAVVERLRSALSSILDKATSLDAKQESG